MYLRSAWLALAPLDVPPSPGTTTVYRFRDSQGVEHFVDQRDEVPPGVKPETVDLSNVPLNHEAARDLAAQAEKSTAQAKQHEAATRDALTVPPPPEARLVATWALALGVLFAALAILRRATRREIPKLSAALLPLAYLTGALALVAGGALVYELRDSSQWLVEHFPALQSLDKARATTEQIGKQQRERDQQIDRALKNP